MRKTYVLPGAIAIALACTANVQADYIGTAQVQSGLGEPLRARVRLNGVRSSQGLETLRAELASEDTYRRHGLPRTELLQQLQLTIDQKQPAIVITTAQPWPEPNLELIVQIIGPGINERRHIETLVPVIARVPQPQPQPGNGSHRETADQQADRGPSAKDPTSAAVQEPGDSASAAKQAPAPTVAPTVAPAFIVAALADDIGRLETSVAEVRKLLEEPQVTGQGRPRATEKSAARTPQQEGRQAPTSVRAQSQSPDQQQTTIVQQVKEIAVPALISSIGLLLVIGSLIRKSAQSAREPGYEQDYEPAQLLAVTAPTKAPKDSPSSQPSEDIDEEAPDDEVDDFFRGLDDIAPNLAYMAGEEARFYADANQFELAEAALLAARANEPNRAELRFQHAELYVRFGKLGQLRALLVQMRASGDDKYNEPRYKALQNALANPERYIYDPETSSIWVKSA